MADHVRPVLLVCGLGRCGTSMVMQMLAAGGVAVTGAAPAHERDETLRLGSAEAQAWLRAQTGRAVKLLDPHRNGVPDDVPAITIWLNRNLDDQAASHFKMLDHVAGETPSRETRRRYAAALRHDVYKGRASLGPRRILLVSFANTLRAPLATAQASRTSSPRISHSTRRRPPRPA